MSETQPDDAASKIDKPPAATNATDKPFFGDPFCPVGVDQFAYYEQQASGVRLEVEKRAPFNLFH